MILLMDERPTGRWQSVQHFPTMPKKASAPMADACNIPHLPVITSAQY